MRALNVRQPWAELIAQGRKRIEVRTWPTTHRGPLVIVASLAYAPNAPRELWDVDGGRGVAVCVVELVDVRRPERLAEDEHFAMTTLGPTLWCWCLAHARRVVPAPVRGQLGLFTLPADVRLRLAR